MMLLQLRFIAISIIDRTFLDNFAIDSMNPPTVLPVTSQPPTRPLASVEQTGTKAPQAAGRIHTDFEKGFIMAEVMKYKDFHELGSEAAVKVCRTLGK